MKNSFSTPINSKEIKLTFPLRVLLLQQARHSYWNQRSLQLPLAEVFKFNSVELDLWSFSAITTRRAISISLYFSLLILFVHIIVICSYKEHKSNSGESKFWLQLKLRKVTLHLKETFLEVTLYLKEDL